MDLLRGSRLLSNRDLGEQLDLIAGVCKGRLRIDIARPHRRLEQLLLAGIELLKQLMK